MIRLPLPTTKQGNERRSRIYPMKAFLRHILRSADSSRTQMSIIIVTIAVVTAMIFVAFSLSDIFYNINMAEYDRVADGADILIGSNFSSNTMFSLNRAKAILSSLPEVEDVSYFYKTASVMKTEDKSKTVLIEATDLEDYLARHPVAFDDEFSPSDLGAGDEFRARFEELVSNYPAVVIGARFAAENSIEVGDIIEVYLPMHENYISLLVRYIASNEGIFSSLADVNILTDFSAVGNIGMITAAYVTLTDPGYFESTSEYLQKAFPSVEVEEGNNYEEVIGIVRNNTMLLAVGLVFLVVTMSLILFTSYLIVARNRMSEMVVFKAAGATPGQVAGIMLAEVGFYALIGAGIGLVLGRLVMTAAVQAMVPAGTGVVDYAVWKYVCSFVLAVAVTVLAALGPVISVSKKTVRELSSSSFKFHKEPKRYTLAISVLLTAGAVTAYLTTSGILLAVSAVGVIAASAFTAHSLVPYILKFFGWLTTGNPKGGAFSVAGLGATRNNAMMSVTTLVAVVIAFSYLVVEVVGMVQGAIVPFETRYRADLVVNVTRDSGGSTLEELDNEIAATDGVEWAGRFNHFDYYIPGSDSDEWTLYGVEDMETLEHCILPSDGMSEILTRWEQALSEGKNPIVLSRDMALRCNYDIGDEFSVSPTSLDYSDEVVAFKVVGIDETVTEYDRVGYVEFGMFTGYRDDCVYLVDVEEGSDKTEVFKALRDRVEALDIPLVFTLEFEEWAYAEGNSLEGVGSLLTLLQVLVYIVAVIGIVNISTVTFFDRRGEFRLYNAIGMSKSDHLKFSFGEALIAGGTGALTGFLIGFGINLLVPSLGSIISKYLQIEVFPVWLLVVTSAAFALFIGCWMAIAAASAKELKPGSYNERTHV